MHIKAGNRWLKPCILYSLGSSNLPHFSAGTALPRRQVAALLVEVGVGQDPPAQIGIGRYKVGSRESSADLRPGVADR